MNNEQEAYKCCRMTLDLSATTNALFERWLKKLISDNECKFVSSKYISCNTNTKWIMLCEDTTLSYLINVYIMNSENEDIRRDETFDKVRDTFFLTRWLSLHTFILLWRSMRNPLQRIRSLTQVPICSISRETCFHKQTLNDLSKQRINTKYWLINLGSQFTDTAIHCNLAPSDINWSCLNSSQHHHDSVRATRSQIHPVLLEKPTLNYLRSTENHTLCHHLDYALFCANICQPTCRATVYLSGCQNLTNSIASCAWEDYSTPAQLPAQYEARQPLCNRQQRSQSNRVICTLGFQCFFDTRLSHKYPAAYLLRI
jgi:hypothetical protein